MFWRLLQFEWLFINSRKSLYIMLLLFAALGIVLGTSANFPFPNTYKNGSYVVCNVIGIISLLCIFSTTLIAAQTLFREREAGFDTILYATPLHKAPYILSRFSVVFFIGVLCYFVFICGLIGGHLLQAGDASEFGPFHLMYYLQPFLILLLPNILFCTAIAVSIGLLTQNKMLVYVSGVFIYFLYWGISFYTDSPLIANSTPVSDTSMRLAALVDPFGISGFLQQTRYWTSIQRNSQILELTGPLLTNRLIYIGASTILLCIAYNRFNLKTRLERSKLIPRFEKTDRSFRYSATFTQTQSLHYDLQCLWSLLRIEIINILKSIPIWIICIGWTAFLSIETMSNIGGNSRIPEQFASTGAMVESILSGLPLTALMVLLFYGNEIYWRSRQTRFHALENATALRPAISLLSKWLSLCFIVLVLILASALTGISIQLLKNNATIDWSLYLTLFYLVGLPLVLNAGLIICLQALIKNKFIGIAVSGIIILLMNTSFGYVIGLKHPLLRFANVFQGDYSELNGFGRELTAFHYQMGYWISVTILFFILVNKLNDTMHRQLRLSAANLVLLLLLTTTYFTGSTIFRETVLPSREAIINQQVAYEKRYGFLRNKAQPVVTSVKTRIDLYPGEERYKVHGEYVLLNKNSSTIDTLYVHGYNEMSWSDWKVSLGVLVKKDEEHSYTVFKLEQSLQPGDSMLMSFDFEFKGSPFRSTAGFNTIIQNGSFIRISKYYPSLGYNTDLEVENEQERKRRNLPLRPTASLESPKQKRDFIRFEAIISTDAPQTAICVGELKKQWKENRRNYFHYCTTSPIPFRFAVASAKYAVKKLRRGNILIETYYHPAHYHNIAHLLKTAIKSLDYCESSFGRYPLQTIRFVEISSFTKGFAGTAYPGSLFINETFGYQHNIGDNPERDILNEMVSHELSHEWWGNAKIAPDEREGSILNTETLAMYTELMVYKKTYGEKYLPERVSVHKNIYLSTRSSGVEKPLYRLDPGDSYLAYDKGMVVMYQLYKFMGEEKINTALKNFYNRFSYPGTSPISTDLLHELYAVAAKEDSLKIDELFKKIVTYDLILNSAVARKVEQNRYLLNVNATVRKYAEDGKGEDTLMPFSEAVEIAIYYDGNKHKKMLVYPKTGNINMNVILVQKPINVVLDPEGKFLNRSDEVKRETVELN